jgi:DNA-binding CsgD family transcriptional regulator
VTSPQVLEDAIDQALENINLDKRKIAKQSFELGDLSDKQVEMMRMVASGLSNVEIAKRQWMTEAAVEKAITRLIKKMNLSSSKEQNQRVMIATIYHQLTGSVNVRTNL